MCLQLGPFSSRFRLGVSEAHYTDCGCSPMAQVAPESIRWRGREGKEGGRDTGSSLPPSVLILLCW